MCWYICSLITYWTAIVSKWYLHLFWSDLNKIKQTNRWDQTPGLTLHTSPIKYVHEGHLSDHKHGCFRFLCWGHIVFQSRMCQDLLAEKCSTVSAFDITLSYIVFYSGYSHHFGASFFFFFFFFFALRNRSSILFFFTVKILWLALIHCHDTGQTPLWWLLAVVIHWCVAVTWLMELVAGCKLVAQALLLTQELQFAGTVLIWVGGGHRLRAQ